MKKVVSVVAVAMFLCAGSAFAAMPGTSASGKGSGYGVDVDLKADTKSRMSNVTNETKIEGSQIMNMGDGNMDVGVVANSAGGEMENVTNKTTITDSEIINQGDGNMRVGTVQN